MKAMEPSVDVSAGAVNVGPRERWLSLAAGAALVAYGLMRSWRALPWLLLGGALATRGYTGHSYLYERLGRRLRPPAGRASWPGGRGIRIEEAVTIGRPVSEVFAAWSDTRKLPRFMKHLEVITPIAENRSLWTARTGGPIPLRLRWEAEIVARRENELLSWRSVPGSDVDIAGAVLFQPAPVGRGTELRTVLTYLPPGGALGLAVASAFRAVTAQQVKNDLWRFKSVLEAGEAPTVEGQPSGRARVIAIDAAPDRLAMAREHGGAETIDFSRRRNVVQALKDMTAGRGPDAGIDAVGMEAVGHTLDALYDRVKQAVRLEAGRPHALREAIQACRKGGTVSIPGVYIGFIDKVPVGAAFGKGLTLTMGQTHVPKYMRTLLDIVRRGAIDPSYLFTQTVRLDEAPRAYAMFAAREPGWVKVMLKPEAVSRLEGRRARRRRAEEEPGAMPMALPDTGKGSPAQRASGAAMTRERLSWAEPEATEVPPVPSQAEGARRTVEEDLCEKGLAPPEECARLPAEEEPEPPDAGRRLPSQAEGEREAVEETLGER